MKPVLRLVLFRSVFFFVYFPIGILFPAFFLYLRTSLGITDREISYANGISGLTVILFQQLWGYSGDMLVSKKRLVIVNLLGASLVFWSMGMVQSIWMILLLYFFFQALFTSINQLLHGFLFTYPDGEKNFGNLRAYASLGFVIANVGVAWLADHVTGGDLRFIFPGFLIMCCVAVSLILPLADHQKPVIVRPSFFSVQNYFLAQKSVRIFLLFAFFYQAAHSLTFVMQAILLKEMGADHGMISLSFSLPALLELPVFFSVNWLRRRLGDVNLLLFAGLVQVVRWLLVWSAASPETIVASSILHCVTFGLFYGAAVGFMNQRADDHVKASAQTLYAFVYLGLATVFGNFGVGQVLPGGWLAVPFQRLAHEVLGLPNLGPLKDLYLLCAGIATFSLGLGFWLFWHEKHHSKRDS